MTQLEFVNRIAEKISAKYFYNGQKVFIGRHFDTFHFDIAYLNDNIEIKIYGKNVIHTLHQPYYVKRFNTETFVSLAKILRSNLNYSDFISQIEEFAQKNRWAISIMQKLKYSTFVKSIDVTYNVSPQGGICYITPDEMSTTDYSLF